MKTQPGCQSCHIQFNWSGKTGYSNNPFIQVTGLKHPKCFFLIYMLASSSMNTSCGFICINLCSSFVLWSSLEMTPQFKAFQVINPWMRIPGNSSVEPNRDPPHTTGPPSSWNPRPSRPRQTCSCNISASSPPPRAYSRDHRFTHWRPTYRRV